MRHSDKRVQRSIQHKNYWLHISLYLKLLYAALFKEQRKVFFVSSQNKGHKCLLSINWIQKTFPCSTSMGMFVERNNWKRERWRKKRKLWTWSSFSAIEIRQHGSFCYIKLAFFLPLLWVKMSHDNAIKNITEHTFDRFLLKWHRFSFTSFKFSLII